MNEAYFGFALASSCAIQSSIASLIAVAKAPLRDPSRSMMACLNRLSSSSGTSTLILTMITHFHSYINTPLRLYINYALLIDWSNRVKQEGMTSVIRNWIQRYRLIKQLRAACYSEDAIHEILRFYGVDPK